MEKRTFTVEADARARVDKYLAERMRGTLSRNQVKNAIEDRMLTANGTVVVHASRMVVPGEELTLSYEPWEDRARLAKQKMDLDVRYEDADVLVVNKPNDLTVHPGAGNPDQTLANALAARLDAAPGLRGGLVHRIDKQTTGLLLVAKNKKALDYLQNQLKQRKVKRTYLAVVKGVIAEKTGRIDAPIGRSRVDRTKMAVTAYNSKEAVTRFKVLQRSTTHTLIECELETGRTHQIRVHLAYIKHPVAGDWAYGPKSEQDAFGQYLHAWKLSFRQPTTKKSVTVECLPPPEFEKYFRFRPK